MSGASQIEQSSCLLLLSNQPTTILSPEALCNLDNSEWDRLTRSNLAEPVIEYLDKLLDKNDGKIFYYKVKCYQYSGPQENGRTLRIGTECCERCQPDFLPP